MSETIRFTIPDIADMSDDQRRVAQAIIDSPRKGIRGPFPMLLRRPAMADATRLLGDCIRYDNSLTDDVKELAILMVVRHWNIDVEWASHKKLALDAGLSEAVLAELERGARPGGLSSELDLAYDVVSELLSGRELSNPTYDRALKSFGEVGVVDLIGTAAYYNYISVIMNGAALPLPDGMTRLPRRS